MTDKTFIVTHSHARSPITVKGKNLNDALEKEGLDPSIWKVAGEQPETEDESLGDNQGAPGSEDN